MEVMFLPALLNKKRVLLSYFNFLYCAVLAAPKASVFSCNSLLRDFPFLKWRNDHSYKTSPMHRRGYGLNCCFFLTHVQDSLSLTETQYRRLYKSTNLRFVALCVWMKELSTQYSIQHCSTLSFSVIIEEMVPDCCIWGVGGVAILFC